MTIKLPYVLAYPSYHIGMLNLDQRGGIQPILAHQSWDFEIHMLSVSVDPVFWLGTNNGTTSVYQITSPLKLLDADLTIARYAAQIEAKAVLCGLAQRSPGGLAETDALYTALRLQIGTLNHRGVGTRDDWVLQTCLAALAEGEDASIDGFWWSVSHPNLRGPRGGIFQWRLPSVGALPVGQPPATIAQPQTFEEASAMLDMP